MHFFKLLVEAWISFGVITVVLGLVWLNRMSRSSYLEIPHPRPAVKKVELEPAEFSSAQSA